LGEAVSAERPAWPREMAKVDWASLWSIRAMRDLRDVTLALESTRWKYFSSTLNFPLSSMISSQSEESSSSSIALASM
jgi:hypothetical protein